MLAGGDVLNIIEMHYFTNHRRTIMVCLFFYLMVCLLKTKEANSMNHQEEKCNCYELRARFTKWLEITLYRAKLDYLKGENRRNNVLFIEDTNEAMKLKDYKSSNELESVIIGKAFDFTNELVEKAYLTLSENEQAILKMLFIDEKDIKEAAKLLGYSMRQSYRFKDSAYKKIYEFVKENGYE